MKSFVAWLILFPAISFGAIQMKCISTGVSGEVTVTWNNSASSAAFRSYHIFHSISDTGPFQLIDSITVYGNQSYLHLSANANNFNAYYYVLLNNTNGTTVMSDTIQAIRLNVIDPGDGYASLLWNSTHQPPVSSNSNYYLIYREYPSGIVTLIDSIDISVLSLNYLDEVAICGDSIHYHVEVSDASGCHSVSNVDGDYFTDRIAPVAPLIDSVSIDGVGNAVIGWAQSTSDDTQGYIIYQTDGTTATPLDTVYGIGNTFYQSAINAVSGSQGFRVVAFDSCGNPCGAEPLQQTIFLEGTLDRCTGSIQLTWNGYVNSPASPLYDILMNENGGGDVLVGNTAANNFTVGNLKTDTLYCFRVLAELGGAGATSTSNFICMVPDLPIAPQFSYIRSVSVFPNDAVTIRAYVDPLAEVKEYRLERSETGTGNFVTIQSQVFAGNTDLVFTDVVSTAQPHYYRVATIDSCGNDAFPSQVCRTIAADTLSSGNFQNTFSWNAYQQWPGISHYEIYKSTDGIYDPDPIAVLTPFDSMYTDDVNEQYSSQGVFCYYLVAYEAPGNPYGFSDSARSNEICFRQKSSVFIPNAFRPEGVNNIFNPAEAFIGLESYSLLIFNRFGEQVFETTNPAEGWDGSAKGHRCETGVYVYRFKARNERGLEIEKTGRVTLIR